MKTLLTILFLLTMSSISIAQFPTTVMEYDAPVNLVPLGIHKYDNNSFSFLNLNVGVQSEFRLGMVRVSDQAEVIWSKQFDFPVAASIGSMTFLSSDEYLLAGVKKEADEIALLKISGEGEVLESSNFEWINSFPNSTSIQELESGEIIVCGIDNGPVVMKVSSNGEPLWSKRYFGYDLPASSGVDNGRVKLIELDNGNLLINAWSKRDFDSRTECLVLEIDTSGEIVWGHMFGGNEDEIFRDLVTTSDGGFLGIGYSGSFNEDGFRDILSVKLNMNGEIEWAKVYQADFEAAMYTVQETSYGTFIATGGVGGSSPGFYCIVIEFDQNGVILRSDGYSEFSSGNRTLLDEQDNLYILGYNTEVSDVNHTFGIFNSSTSTDCIYSEIDLTNIDVELIVSDELEVENLDFEALGALEVVASDFPLEETLLCDEPVSIGEEAFVSTIEGILVKPNPSSGPVTFEVSKHLMENGEMEWEIRNSKGYLIKQGKTAMNLIEIDSNELPAGLYVFQAKNKSGMIKMVRFMMD